VDTHVLFLAGLGCLYLLIVLLLMVKGLARRSRAVQIHAASMEIDFALREGHTVVGVIDAKQGLCFVIGNDAGEEKEYE
jgi:hypothetical protein